MSLVGLICPRNRGRYKRYKINDAPNWTYSYRIERDEFDDRITSVSHYVSISNFNAQWYEVGNSNLGRLQETRIFNYKDFEEKGAFRLSIECGSLEGPTSLMPHVILLLGTGGYSPRGKAVRAIELELKIDLRVDRKPLRVIELNTFQRTGTTNYLYLSINGKSSAELLEYMRGGESLILRVPGIPQTYRLDITSIDRAYQLISAECRRKHHPEVK